MDLLALDLDAPLFTQKEAVTVCTVENATIDNWVRHGHISPRRSDDRRLFSAWDMVTIDLIDFLATKFGLRPSDGCKLAARIVSEYRPLSRDDVVGMNAGQSWTGPYWGVSQPETYGFTRDGAGLRETREGDAEIDTVGIVVPTQLVARRTFGAIRRLERDPA
jgi:hypothetical protein